LQQIKAKLEQNRMTAPLFDAKLYAKNLERAFQMIQKYQEDRVPIDIRL
jgi:predicted O-linked N-acetylglucosamine transferase (SPINDLY family)